MKNRVLNRDERLSLAKEHKKLFEDYSITQFAYKLEDRFFYSAYYESKFSTTVKAEAVVSADTENKDKLMDAYYSLSFYVLYINKVEDVGGERANLNMQVFHDIKDYIESIIRADVLNNDNQLIYERALKTIKHTIALQDDMIQLYHDATALDNKVAEKGFFTDDELDQLAGYLPYIEIIQYNEARIRYKYRKDFDVIYKNRNDPEIKPFDIFTDDKVLRELTSDYSGKDLEQSLMYLSDNKDISGWTEEEHYKWLIDKQTKSAKKRIEELKQRLRYP
jgi:hypothetical protein